MNEDPSLPDSKISRVQHSQLHSSTFRRTPQRPVHSHQVLFVSSSAAKPSNANARSSKCLTHLVTVRVRAPCSSGGSKVRTFDTGNT